MLYIILLDLFIILYSASICLSIWLHIKYCLYICEDTSPENAEFLNSARSVNLFVLAKEVCTFQKVHNFSWSFPVSNTHQAS